MSLEGNTEGNYIQMSYIPPPAEMTDENGYEIMTSPGYNLLKNMHTPKPFLKYVRTTDLDEEENSVKKEENKMKRLAESLDKLFNLQNDQIDEAVYTYINEDRYSKVNNPGSSSDQSAYYESIGEVNPIDVLQASVPSTSKTINKSLQKLDFAETGKAVKDNLTCQISAIHKVLHKVDNFITVLDNVVKSNGEQAEDIPLQQMQTRGLDSVENLDELKNSLNEMKALVREIRRLTSPKSAVTTPVNASELTNVVVRDTHQVVSNDNSSVLAKILKARNLFRSNTSGNRTYLFHTSMILLIILFAIGVGFVTYFFMKK